MSFEKVSPDQKLSETNKQHGKKMTIFSEIETWIFSV